MKNTCLHDSIVNFPSFKQFYSPLIDTLPLPQCEVCVIIPVQNEEELLEGCLNALAYQVDLEGKPLNPARYEAILLANNCTDNSVAIAQRFSKRNRHFRLHIIERTLPPSEAYIGRVRQLLMDEAYYRLLGLGLAGLGNKHGIIASTDGDSRVSSTWIAATLLEISQGVDAVGGRIVADDLSCDALDSSVKKRYLQGDYYHQLKIELETYLDPNPFDTFPRHAQHYGASLAVTAQMYKHAGGMPSVRTPEDVEFYRALLRVGAKFRHSPLVQVTTSARQTVRTEGGFAAQLNEWETMSAQNRPFLVESAEAIATQFKARCQLRNLWECILNGYQHTVKDVIFLADTIGITPQWLLSQLTQPHSFELLFERIEQRQQQDGIWRQRWSLVSLEQAIADLNTYLQELRMNNQKIQPKRESELVSSLDKYAQTDFDKFGGHL
jgi:hypothetical protein